MISIFIVAFAKTVAGKVDCLLDGPVVKGGIDFIFTYETDANCHVTESMSPYTAPSNLY